jgi:hypothetical protein
VFFGQLVGRWLRSSRETAICEMDHNIRTLKNLPAERSNL